jgi:hypothetical protein
LVDLRIRLLFGIFTRLRNLLRILKPMVFVRSTTAATLIDQEGPEEQRGGEYPKMIQNIIDVYNKKFKKYKNIQKHVRHHPKQLKHQRRPSTMPRRHGMLHLLRTHA